VDGIVRREVRFGSASRTRVRRSSLH
jgi:hypothetical protein